jgi:nitroreductase
VDFRDVVRKRRMVRAFSDAPVAPDALERILDVARRGPSAGYSQGVQLVIICDADQRAAVAQALQVPEGLAKTLRTAPVHVLICTSAEIYKQRYREADKSRVRAGLSDDELWQVPFWHVDAGCAMMLLLLAAVNEGIDVGFIGVRQQEALRALLGIPSDYSITGLAMLGHRAAEERPQGSARTRPRRAREDVLHRERW